MAVEISCRAAGGWRGHLIANTTECINVEGERRKKRIKPTGAILKSRKQKHKPTFPISNPTWKLF